jgi:tRNA(adenine34) deaminase
MAEVQKIITENIFINAALDEAKIAFEENEVPVGAVIVKDGQIIARAHNQNIALFDPTAHAEILVIRSAAQNLSQKILADCDLYVTLEPCLMCAAAISTSRIRRLYYCVGDEKYGAYETGEFFKSKPCYHRPEIYSGFKSEISASLLKKFFADRR